MAPGTGLEGSGLPHPSATLVSLTALQGAWARPGPAPTASGLCRRTAPLGCRACRFSWTSASSHGPAPTHPRGLRVISVAITGRQDGGSQRKWGLILAQGLDAGGQRLAPAVPSSGEQPRAASQPGRDEPVGEGGLPGDKHQGRFLPSVLLRAVVQAQERGQPASLLRTRSPPRPPVLAPPRWWLDSNMSSERANHSWSPRHGLLVPTPLASQSSSQPQ